MTTATIEVSEAEVQHFRAMNALERCMKNGDVHRARGAIMACHEFIAQRVRCVALTSGMQPAYALIGTPWPAEISDQLSGLLSAYLRSGLLRINDQVDAFETEKPSSWTRPGMTLMEGAIRRKRYDLLPLLAREGERLDLAPTVQDQEPAHPDMMALLNYWSPEAHAGFLAELMHERIAAVAAESTAAVTRPNVSSRTRRAGL
ncbi:hypothetical protein ABIC83_002495 [Roseateles asaccharophilus]|uniref:hypothetical protein n=1 Tax=Roseateles asaccharophilus TaxID=582607 RepID=UPI003835A690